jgi:hypothetical protein
MKALSASAVAILATLTFAGCAQDGTLTTGALDSSMTPTAGPDPKNDPVCLTLASQIEALKKDGVPEKVSKAAAKKYKMKTADLAKADELNKAHAEFQARCSAYPPSADIAAATPAETAPATKVANKKPPVPAQKPVTAAAAPSPESAPVTTTTTTTTTAAPDPSGSMLLPMPQP